MGSSLSSCCGSEKVEQGCVSSSPMSSTWRIFSYKELHAATNGFSEENKLGEGGFGSVYWGKTSDGLQIAVKKLKATNNSKAEMEFAVEVEVLARVRHRNLLGLRGYCAGADQRMIVYDYMPNLSLLSHLHGQFAGEVQLDWKRRVAVAVGSAEGLVYLHHEAAPHIIHRDIKASNVLLDSDFAPLVADFGFAKLVPEGVSHMTTRVKGTLGYLAPEYAMWGKVSGACDVYSFGILLLELVSGRKPIERLPSGAKRTITEWAEPLIARGRLGDLVDPRLRGAFDAAQLARVVECAALCVQGEPDRRPDMRTVVRILRGENVAAAAAAAAAATVGARGGGKGEQKVPVRIESVKYADRLMEMDKSSSMNFGAFGAMPVQQTMQDPYVKRFSGNANAIKI
ncbi:PTI1-like tyrosine-protein kinase At3g15890 [Sorghum bicolor]|uniref:PTI1-like tyrosine-protein kinase At3g15890 n=1 Tax=Sorghum bicolor TaxID=4558 RepID=UPI000B42620D|nr:PTI1-like tyrosine-protein kinase At3g15890 [Sorghum bicolor]|eukprot:XP_021305588.1 PTI1-like tyrosine-protein kinase At3g15890 [Sorghum bicolor]